MDGVRALILPMSMLDILDSLMQMSRKYSEPLFKFEKKKLIIFFLKVYLIWPSEITIQQNVKFDLKQYTQISKFLTGMYCTYPTYESFLTRNVQKI